MTDVTTNAAGNKSIKMGESSTAGDWINRIIADYATSVAQEAVEACDAVKDDKGEIVTPAVRARAAKTAVDPVKLDVIAEINALELKAEYPNPGMKRMALSNKMRAAAKRRGGLMLPNGREGAAKWCEAPEDFQVNEKLTENPDGTKIAAKPEPKAED